MASLREMLIKKPAVAIFFNSFYFNITDSSWQLQNKMQLECGPMSNLMVALPNIGGALCSTPQSLAGAHY